MSEGMTAYEIAKAHKFKAGIKILKNTRWGERFVTDKKKWEVKAKKEKVQEEKVQEEKSTKQEADAKKNNKYKQKKQSSYWMLSSFAK